VEAVDRAGAGTFSAMNDFTLVGGPTALFQHASLRWMTDPAFSPPGDYDYLTKLTGPAIDAGAVGDIDVILLSHDHHADNLDPGGRALLPRAGRVLTTAAGADRLGGNAIGLEPWSSVQVDPSSGGPAVTVTAVPAQHGPDGTDHITGPVIGFVLSAPGAGTVYVSGDNASLDVVREIAQRASPIDVAVLFAGAVQIAQRFDGAYLTLSSDRAAEAARILGARLVVPVHFEGWKHFTQCADALRAAFAGNQLTDVLRIPERGLPLALD
jgi:L-ascorbate metabolism protein UlaG (beta-lactamase superfamily)